MPFIQNIPFISIIAPIVCAIICLQLSPRKAKRVTLACLSSLAAASAALLCYALRLGQSFTYKMGSFPSPWGNEIRAGSLEAFLALLFCTVCLCAVAGGSDDIEADLPPVRISYYFLMQNMMIGAMLALIYTNDLFTAYVFIEILTISASSVVSAKPGGRTLAATMVYLFMSLVGSCLLLFSISILYGVTGHLLMPGLQTTVAVLAATGRYTLPLFVTVGLMTAGLGIKSALFPFHSWLPEAHASATTSASAVLSGLIVKSYLILLIKMICRVFGLEMVRNIALPYILVAFGAAGILYGSATAIRQKSIKLMLSYGSVSQIGYICLAIGLCTAAGLAAACYHITVHAIAKAMLFTSAGRLSVVSEHSKSFDKLRGAARRDPLAGAAFVIGGLTMVGIPPFPGFTSKLYLATASMNTGFAPIVLFVAILASTVLGAMYYFPAIACLMAQRNGGDVMKTLAVPRTILPTASLVAFISLTLLLGLFSQQVIGVIAQGLAVFG